MPPSRAAPLGNGPDELHADRVYLEVTRDADGPGKLASREPLAKRRAQPVTGVRQHTAVTRASRMIEMMSIEPHDGRMELEHSTKSIVRAQSVAKSARAVIFSRPQAGFLAELKIASILSALTTGGR